MSTPKHTPGPWAAIDRKSIYPGNSRFWITGSNGDPRIIAEVSYVKRGDEFHANARLIAAAPDLLTALDELLLNTLDTEQNAGFVLTKSNRLLRNKCLAAIAKATGGDK